MDESSTRSGSNLLQPVPSRSHSHRTPQSPFDPCAFKQFWLLHYPLWYSLNTHIRVSCWTPTKQRRSVLLSLTLGRSVAVALAAFSLSLMFRSLTFFLHSHSCLCVCVCVCLFVFGCVFFAFSFSFCFVCVCLCVCVSVCSATKMKATGCWAAVVCLVLTAFGSGAHAAKLSGDKTIPEMNELAKALESMQPHAIEQREFECLTV